jgi:uncharacterized protein with beta-barrel porin domain
MSASRAIFGRGAMAAAIFAVIAGVSAAPAQAACVLVGMTLTCTGADTTGFGDGTQSNHTINILPGATVTVGDSAIAFDLNSNNTITNAGTITVGDLSAVISAIDGNTIVNAGSIVAGNNSAGISVKNNNSILNSGSISLQSFSIAIDICCSNVSVINTGTITGGDFSAGIFGADGNTVVNSGTMTLGDNSNGIDLGDGNTVTNSGKIVVGNGGVAISALDGNTIDNHGTLTAGSGGGGIVVGDNNNIVTNYGTINVGFSGAAISAGDGNQITNFGTLNVGAGGGGFALGDSNTVNNSGRVSAPVGYAIYGGSDNAITNTGTMIGMIMLFGIDNTVTNRGTIVSSDMSTTVGAINLIGGTLINDPTGTIGIRVDPFDNDAYQADVITLNGGRLNVIVMPGLYGPTSVYSSSTSFSGYAPLTACSCGLTGTFSTVTSSSPFFMASANYDYANGEVNITLSRIAFNAVPGMTNNQKAVGNVLEPFYDPLTLTGDAATFYAYLLAAGSLQALDILSSEGTAATQTTAFNANQLFNSAQFNQVAAWLSGNTGGALSYAQADAKSAPAAFKALEKDSRVGGWHVWLSGFYGQAWAGGENPAGSANVKANTGGGAFGADYQAAPDTLVGFAVGASQSRFDVRDRMTDGELLGGHLGVYAAKTWGAFYTAASASYARFDNSTTRTISIGGATETAKGNFASDLLGGRLEAGYRTRQGQYDVTPFVAIEPSHLWQRGYAEASFDTTGAPGVFGLTYGARSVSSLPLFLGAQVDTRWIAPNGMLVVPQLRASWVHEFMPEREISAAFITLPDAAFTVQGARAASDSAKINAGARLFLNPAAYMFANVDGEFSERTASVSGTAGFKSTW